MITQPPFHLAIEVQSLNEARSFYGKLLGCKEGRSSQSWVDFNFFGHQLVCHLTDSPRTISEERFFSLVDGQNVPLPHFGVVLDLDTWKKLSIKLQSAKIEFIIEPHIRFQGQTGEQATMFLFDQSGNALEFKAFRDVSQQLFAK